MENLKGLPTLKDMLAAAMSQGEEEVETKTAGVESQEQETPETETEEQPVEEGSVKTASILALADQLDEAAESLTKVAGTKSAAHTSILSRLGGKTKELQTNIGTMLKGKEQKRDKSRTGNIPMTPPLASGKGPDAMQTNDTNPTEHTEQPDNIMKTSAAKAAKARQEKLAALKARIFAKLGGEDVSPAKISAPHGANPENEAAKKQPQSGDRALIGSNEAARRFTKGQAKSTPKKVLKTILREPALSKGTDGKLHENLVNAGRAGVKISAARGYLQKVASRAGTPAHNRLVERLQSFREKKAAASKLRGKVRAALQKKSFFPRTGGMMPAGSPAGAM